MQGAPAAQPLLAVSAAAVGGRGVLGRGHLSEMRGGGGGGLEPADFRCSCGWGGSDCDSEVTFSRGALWGPRPHKPME